MGMVDEIPISSQGPKGGTVLFLQRRRKKCTVLRVDQARILHVHLVQVQKKTPNFEKYPDELATLTIVFVEQRGEMATTADSGHARTNVSVMLMWFFSLYGSVLKNNGVWSTRCDCCGLDYEVAPVRYATVSLKSP